MAVLCIGCRAEVSEWAARCPYCRRSLADAELLPEPEAQPESERLPADAAEGAGAPDAIGASARDGVEPAKQSPSRRTARAKMTVAAVIAAVVVVSGLLVAGRLDKPTAHANPGGLPDALASERLFFAEPGRTGLYLADGTPLRTFSTTAGVGYVQPLLSSRGVLVYIHGDRVYRTSGTGVAAPMIVGPGTSIFPTVLGGIGIQSPRRGRPTAVTYMPADGGTVSSASHGALPSAASVVALVPKGLLVETPGGFADPIPEISSLLLSVVEPRTDVFLGRVTAVIGTYRAFAAWTTCPAPRSSNCALSVTNTTSTEARTVQPPAGYSGWAESGGAFSPDGGMLAAFVPSRRPGGAMVLHLVVVNVATGAASVVGPAVPTNSLLAGAATWSADGHWLYFGGITGPLHAEQIGPAGPHGHSWRLPLATSGAVAGD